MNVWFPALALLAAVLAGGAIVALRRTQARVPDAPIVELATVPSDRGFWLRERLNETIGGGRPPAQTLDTLTLHPETTLTPLPQPIAVPVPSAAPNPSPVIPTPLAMPLAATSPHALPHSRPHSPFANQAVQNGRIGLMDEAGDNPEFAWHTPSAAPTSFSDPTLPSAPIDPHNSDGAISLDRATPTSIDWSGPSD